MYYINVFTPRRLVQKQGGGGKQLGTQDHVDKTIGFADIHKGTQKREKCAHRNVKRHFFGCCG
jgi:hypothetical protein